jgi:hypothetical protein
MFQQTPINRAFYFWTTTNQNRERLSTVLQIAKTYGFSFPGSVLWKYLQINIKGYFRLLQAI